MKNTASTIADYNRLQTGEAHSICEELHAVISSVLKNCESKIWHGAPVWFDNGNPLVGYSVRSSSKVVVLFWSGQSFNTPGLEKAGSFKAAQVTFIKTTDIQQTLLKKWLREAKNIQWNYKNIVKNKGKLNPLKGINSSIQKLDTDNWMQSLSKPAQTALLQHGIDSLNKLSQFSVQELLRLHGLGPASIPLLQKTLQGQGLQLKKD